MSELRSRAIRLLARREHSRAELARKLAGLGTSEEIEILLAELQQNQLLSDARVADAYLRSHAGRFGAARLRRDLAARGIAPELIEQGLADAGAGSEAERARAIWTRKFGKPPANPAEWGRQARFLQARGFAADIIQKLLRGRDTT